MIDLLLITEGNSSCVASVADVDYTRAYVVFEYCAVEDNMVAVEDVQGCLGEVSATSM